MMKFNNQVSDTHCTKASGGTLPAAFNSKNTAADLSKSQPFSSKHLADHSRFMPDLAAREVARLCLEDRSSSATGATGAAALLTTAASVQSGVANAFLALSAVAGHTWSVSLTMTKPAPCGTTMKHLKEKLFD